MTQMSVNQDAPETQTAAQDKGEAVPLDKRFQILRYLPGSLHQCQYLAQDRQEDRYVLLSIAKWEQEATLLQEYAISQQLHHPQISRHITQCFALYRGKDALDCLASLPVDDYNKLSHTHATELVLVSEFISAIGRPEQAADTLQSIRRLLHVDEVALPSGAALRFSPQSAFLFELMGRELVAILEEFATANVVHAGLQPQKLALCIDPSALLTGFQEGQQHTFIKAIDLNTALSVDTPAQVPQRDLAFQSPQRLAALLGGNKKPITAQFADDVFSMGAILYVLLTGNPPYASSMELPWFDRARALHQQWEQAKAPPALVHEWIESDVLRAIESMCAFAQEDRPTPASLVATFSRAWSKTARQLSDQLLAAPPTELGAWLQKLRTMPGLLQELKKESLQPFPSILRGLPEWLQQSTEALEQIVEAQQLASSHHEELLLQADEKQQATDLVDATAVAAQQLDQETRNALLAEVRQEAFEAAYQEAYRKVGEESFKHTNDLLLMRSQPSHPMQTQNVAPATFEPAQIDALEENLVQLKQEYTQLHTLFRLEQEQTQMVLESVFATMDERDQTERESLLTLQAEIDATKLELNQRLQALQAEEEVLRTSLTQLQQRFQLRSKVRSGGASMPHSSPQESSNILHSLHKPHPPEDPMDGFAPPIQRAIPSPPSDVIIGTSIEEDKASPDKVFMPVYRSEPARLLSPPPASLIQLHSLPAQPSANKLMTTAAIDLLDEINDDDDEFDDVQVIVGTPAMPSELELPTADPAPETTDQHHLGHRLMKEPAIARLPSSLQSELMSFFQQLTQVHWFGGEGDPSHVYNLMQQHLRRLEPFAKAMQKPKPRLIAMFRSGTNQLQQLMASAELLSARVEKVFALSLSNQPDNWSVAGQAVWACLRDIDIPPGRSRFQATQWMVPWDTACDAILETTWIAANDVAWSVARDAPRFAASDAAADAANDLQRAPARSAVWSVTWEHVRHAASGAVWSASNNAASDVANDIAWRLVHDRMSTLDHLNPFSPLFRVWAAGWWPIHLASGDTILWAPLDDPNALEVHWEFERGEYRP